MNQFQLPRYYGPTVSARDAENRKLGAIANAAPRIPWDDFVSEYMDWQPGEHVGLIGPTGQGKTTLMLELVKRRPFVVAFATKPYDESMDRLVNDDGFIVLDAWKQLDPIAYPKRIIWPDARRLDSNEIQKKVFTDAFQRIYIEGKWTLVIDELFYFSELLRMNDLTRMFLTQARSLKISMVNGTQRPARVPRELYSSSTHLFLWRVNDANDLQAIADLGAADGMIVRDIVRQLEKYQCLYVNTRTGFMCRTKAPSPD